jgi:D-glutamate N-acetyltransferase
VDLENRRRYVILAEGQFGEPGSKTAMGVIRYGPDPVVAVLDSTRAGRDVSEWFGPDFAAPIVATLAEALALEPSALLIGTAPQGGKIPPDWRSIISDAIVHGLDVVSGLHEFVSDDPEFASLAAAHGVELIDHRRPPERHEVASGRRHGPGKHVILVVGTDCAIGKMTVALELRRAAREAGLSTAFVPTGQTGIMIEGWGVSVDRVISDFINGTAEWLVEQAEAMGDWIFVEGQGSIDHPAYSAVTLGLVHGTTPQAMVLVHQPGRSGHFGWEQATGVASPTLSLSANIRLYESVANAVAPSRVAAIALNTSLLDEAAARAEIERVAAETGLPTDDPYRFGPQRLFAALRASLEVSA